MRRFLLIFTLISLVAAACGDDDTGTTDAYFCSDPCYSHSDCVGGCCYDTGGEAYCAPRQPYCVQ